MFQSLERVDWALLHRQKCSVVEMLNNGRFQASKTAALWGIVHLIDALQDDAVALGRWEFPDDSDSEGGV